MITNFLIAPCGMNCGICLAFLRDKNRCLGCREEDKYKRLSCQQCSIANCELLSKTDSKFCYDCQKFPCRRLRQLDKRYRTKYHMSMIENLEQIRNKSLDHFVESENKRWICPVCGAILCVHSDFCLNCKKELNSIIII